jgi:hypothetical protein
MKNSFVENSRRLHWPANVSKILARIPLKISWDANDSYLLDSLDLVSSFVGFEFVKNGRNPVSIPIDNTVALVVAVVEL